MKLFKGIGGRALVVGLSFLTAAGMASAYDTETDTVEVFTVVSTLSEDPSGFMVRMSTPDVAGTGLCTGGGWISVDFDGDGSKAVFQSLIAANSGGRSVTLHYVNDSGTCYLAYVEVH